MQGDHLVGLAVGEHPGVGQLHSAGGAAQEHAAEGLLQVAQVFGSLARGDAELGRRRSEGSAADDGDQQPHQVEGVELVVTHERRPIVSYWE